jgi:hypothetical protein
VDRRPRDRRRPATVDWGAGALVRSGGRAVEVRWEATRETRPATAERACALCFGQIAAGETMAVCICETAVHADCFTVMISCPNCGEAA